MNMYLRYRDDGRRIILLLICCFAVMAAVADDFTVRDVRFVHDNNGYAVRADLVVAQPQRLDALLRGGYQIPLRFDLHFNQARDWWADKFVGEIVWRAVLSYNVLLKRYVLEVGDKRKLYLSIDDLVRRVSTLQGSASNQPNFVKIFEQEDIYVETRFLMEVDTLPDPIKIDLLLDDDWNTGGLWKTFPLKIKQTTTH